MQTLLRWMAFGLVGLAGMTPAAAIASTLTHVPFGAPLCLSTAAPAACNDGGPSNQDYSFSFDLSGVAAADEIITGAVLTLVFSDDSGRGDGGEKARVLIDGTEAEANGDANHPLVLPLLDLSMLDDHLLSVGVRANSGDFFFGSATLALVVEPRPEDLVGDLDVLPAVTAVPLPASLVLVGLGVLALGARRRR